VADLSFRSIVKAAARIIDLVAEKKLIALVKPQFEARKEHLIRGIVSSDRALEETLIKWLKTSQEKALLCRMLYLPDIRQKGKPGIFFPFDRRKRKKAYQPQRSADKAFQGLKRSVE
jgi:predicted rRNA methylase YqxC with S4 and FtsJ domains